MALLALSAAAALAAVAAACGQAETGAGGSAPGEAAGASAPIARTVPANPVLVRTDLPYRGAERPALDVYRRARLPTPRPAVLVVHGGSWRAGDKVAVAPIARELARAGFVAFGVGYTLVAPGRAGYPRQPRELRAAIRFVRRNARRFRVDPRRVGALGFSAGAHLVALVGVTGRGPLTRGGRLGAVASWSGPLDLRTADLRRVLGFEVDEFLGCRSCPGRAAAASPIANISPDDPPTMVVNSSDELIPVSQARRMARRLRGAGLRAPLWVLPGNLHAPLFASTVMQPTIEFLRRNLRRSVRAEAGGGASAR